jgi:hypothetical protein
MQCYHLSYVLLLSLPLLMQLLLRAARALCALLLRALRASTATATVVHTAVLSAATI